MPQNKQPNRDLRSHREQLTAMTRTLLDTCEIDFDRSTQLDQALIGTFLFGMIQTHGMLQGMTPPEVHALALIVFKESLHFTDSFAALSVQDCIDATQPGYHDTLNAILHRGIDGHEQFRNGDIDALRKNLTSILEHYRKPE